MSVYSKYNDEIIELLNEDLNNSQIARKILKENYTDSFRKHVGVIRDLSGITKACKNVGVNPKDVPMLWLKKQERECQNY